jgi:ubiquinone/menaquinone biosynthesis C-methylase UbiE
VKISDDVAPFLKAGIPNTGDYKHLLETSFFRTMETFSDAFVQKNTFLKNHYKWVDDPLHQWSRQWEYSYVYRSIKEYATTQAIPHSPIKVLDAGSGVTFFPYYMENSIGSLDITCCDSDGGLAPLFDRVNQSADVGGKVKFVKTDLHTLPFENDSINVVYCISVLEHTRNYARILDEFRRILRPEGCLVLTFDIGLDGVSEIAPESARALLGEVRQRFASPNNDQDIETRVASILTSRYATKLDSRLVPWRFPRLSLIKAALRAKRIPTCLGKNLTVYCDTFVKSASRA